MSSAGEPRVYRNARVRTLDPRNPRARCFLVEDGRFVWAGDEPDRGDLPRGAQRVDLDGAVVVPGFHDAHTHLSAGALTAGWVDLRRAASASAAAALVASAARELPPGRWIRGFGWDQSKWPGANWPSRRDLDPVVPVHPVLLTRGDGHVAWLNGAALERIGWNERTLDPEGGTIVREPGSQRPSGLAFETAAEIASAAIPEPDDAERRGAVERALRLAAAAGITSVDDVLEPWGLAQFDRLRRDGALTLRVHGWLPIATPRAEAEELRAAHPAGDPWISTGTLKVFLDGTLGARSAALHEPYADAPATRGSLRVDPEELAIAMRHADDAGWAIAMHAIGDRAVTLAADLLDRSPARPRLRRHRVEHLQVARSADLARIARSGAVASIQPAHFFDDRHFLTERLGEARANAAYPLRTLEQLGAPLVFGSDWPVSALDPVESVVAASVKRSAAGEPYAKEALELTKALHAATSAGAVARGEADLGRIAPGFRADFVVLSSDFPASTTDLSNQTVRVLATYVSGTRVHPVQND